MKTDNYRQKLNDNKEIYMTDEGRLALARQLAQEAIVLLKNEGGLLPLVPGTKIAVYGKTQNRTIISGGGSGQAHSDHPLQITQELAAAGLVPDSALVKWYDAYAAKKDEEKASSDGGFDFSKLEGLVASGMIYEIFGQYNAPEEEPLPDAELLRTDAGTAVLVIGRCSGGEECDRRVENDYYLLESELRLAQEVCANYEKVVLVLNTNGAVDLSWTGNCPQIRAILFMGTAGEQGAGALADIMTGKVSPSGRLSQTFALSYEDYPTAKNMTWNKDDPNGTRTYEDYGLSAAENGSIGYKTSPVTFYEEDIYLGYRYFDSFHKEVMYPFGYGLTYADFETQCEGARLEDGKVLLEIRVTNRSERHSGRYSVPVYLHALLQDGQSEHPYKELAGFAKTKELAPGECEVLTAAVPLSSAAVFDEEQRAWIIESGAYDLIIGKNPGETSFVSIARLIVEEEIVTAKAAPGSEKLGIQPVNKDKLSFLKKGTSSHCSEGRCPEVPFERTLTVLAGDVISGSGCETPVAADAEGCSSRDPKSGASNSCASNNGAFADGPIQLKDVAAGRARMEDFTAQMSVRELAVLCNGYGPGLPFGGIGVKDVPSTICDEEGNEIGYNSHKSAMPGYENPAIRKYGIYSAFYKDGPASVGGIAWPTGMMLGCTFNPELLYRFGAACGREAQDRDVDAWLAPAVNLIRNPIGGRDFEYFSEDPYLSGVCGVMISKGAMENNQVSVCPKHFALNEQETWRRGKTSRSIDAADSIVTEKAARQLYLKPFEMIIREAKPRVIMSSFNKINGTFAAGCSALMTAILRDEWGYEGVAVTDWGDMDAVVDGADAVEAGNDVVMPGGPPVIAQVLKGYEEGRVSRKSMEKAVAHLMNFVMNSASYAKAAEE